MLSSWSGRRAALILLVWVFVMGCEPFLSSDAEEKNPLIADARGKKAAYNYQGAVESLEKALEANPRLALAHWELGLIYSQHLPDHAAAIYHFQKLLRLRPDWRQADIARQFVLASTIELAKEVPLGPVTPQVQRQLDQLTAKVFDLNGQLARLTQDNQRLTNFIQQVQAENLQLVRRTQALQAALTSLQTSAAARLIPPPNASNLPPTAAGGQAWRGAATGTPDPNAGPPPTPGQPRVAPNAVPPVSTTQPRTYTVQRGDRLFNVAARFGVTLRQIVAANPGLDPNRVKAGRVIQIPAPARGASR